MEYSAKVIAGLLNGEIEGNPDVTVNNVSKIEEGKKGTIAFLANPKYTKYLYTTDASIVLINKELKLERGVRCTLIRVDNAYEAFASLLEMQNQDKPSRVGIHPSAVVEPTAKLGADVYLGATCYIGENVILGDQVKIYPQVYVGDNVKIDKNTIIYPGVKIYHDSVIGSGCVIHAGTVIGSDGFGFAPKSDKNYRKIPQIGNVVIEDNVEIGANATIDRATIGSTIIGKGVKLDNLIQIAHNVEIGENTVMAAQTGVSGSTKIGKECMFGGQVGLIGHLIIANGVKIAAQSGVSKSLKEPEMIVQGSPCFNFTDYQKSYVFFRKLPELKAKIDSLEKDIKALKGN
jgi:UDP-3-O-[3-hydroxymyristoyl] glucosamine N-acyltransferase